MKTTRRALLQMIGLSAAAAALAPAGGVETASAAPSEPMTACGHITAECCDVCWGTGGVEDEHDAEFEQAIVANMPPGHDWPSWKAAIEQARADGYNRGREVEMDRAESRQERGPLTLDEFDAAWSALDGAVRGEMGSGPVVKGGSTYIEEQIYRRFTKIPPFPGESRG